MLRPDLTSRRLRETTLKFVYVLSLGLSPTHTHIHIHAHTHIQTSLMYPRTFFWYCKYSEINNRFYSRDASNYCVPQRRSSRERFDQFLMFQLNPSKTDFAFAYSLVGYKIRRHSATWQNIMANWLIETVQNRPFRNFKNGISLLFHYTFPFKWLRNDRLYSVSGSLS